MTSLEYSSTQLSAALDAVARELTQLAIISADTQLAVSVLLEGAEPGAVEVSGRLQNLDRIAQYADQLAVFLDRISRLIPPDYRVDAAQAATSVRLSEMAQRLSCRPSEVSAEANTPAGALDWF